MHSRTPGCIAFVTRDTDAGDRITRQPDGFEDICSSHDIYIKGVARVVVGEADKRLGGKMKDILRAVVPMVPEMVSLSRMSPRISITRSEIRLPGRMTGRSAGPRLYPITRAPSDSSHRASQLPLKPVAGNKDLPAFI